MTCNRKVYKSNKNIAFIARKFNIPWATVRDWVYERAKPRIFHSSWIKELRKNI
jgi:hypothetical protein